MNPSLNAYCTRRRRAGAGRGPSRDGRARQAWRRPRPAARRAGLDQGPDADQGHPHHLGLEGLRAPRAGRPTALVVERLKAAGAIVVGKTNTPEFGAGANTFNEVFGVTRNPWNPEADLRRLDRRRRGGAGHRARARSPRAPTSAARSACPRRSAAWSASAPRPGYVPVWPGANLWDTLSVQGPMARTVADTALMLSDAGRSRPPRADLLSRGRARAILAAVKPAQRQGAAHRVGRRSRHHAAGSRGPARDARPRSASSARSAPGWRPAHPDFSEVDEIVRATPRAVDGHAPRGASWRSWKPQMQPNLVRNIEQGL